MIDIEKILKNIDVLYMIRRILETHTQYMKSELCAECGIALFPCPAYCLAYEMKRRIQTGVYS